MTFKHNLRKCYEAPLYDLKTLTLRLLRSAQRAPDPMTNMQVVEVCNFNYLHFLETASAAIIRTTTEIKACFALLCVYRARAFMLMVCGHCKWISSWTVCEVCMWHYSGSLVYQVNGRCMARSVYNSVV